MIPELQTQRLRLREYTLADFPAHAASWADPRTRRHFAAPFSEEDCWVRFLRNFGQWQLFGYGNWAVEEKPSGLYVGALGFFQAKRTMDLPYRDMPEAGWVIAPDHHGKGYAFEAMQAATAWADAYIDAPQSWCLIDPDNDPSRRLALKLGYRQAMDSDYKGKPVVTYLRPRNAP